MKIMIMIIITIIMIIVIIIIPSLLLSDNVPVIVMRRVVGCWGAHRGKDDDTLCIDHPMPLVPASVNVAVLLSSRESRPESHH